MAELPQLPPLPAAGPPAPAEPGLLERTIGRHAVAAAVVLALLAVLVLVLAYYFVHYRGECRALGRSGFAGAVAPGPPPRCNGWNAAALAETQALAALGSFKPSGFAERHLQRAVNDAAA